ncbi:hypothetical protein J6590_008329 [Homalodisca vitripennis]|nr:hypothetical protein J6590_008329 [Homalodisca vitripennis]
MPTCTSQSADTISWYKSLWVQHGHNESFTEVIIVICVKNQFWLIDMPTVLTQSAGTNHSGCNMDTTSPSQRSSLVICVTNQFWLIGMLTCISQSADTISWYKSLWVLHGHNESITEVITCDLCHEPILVD